MIPILLALVGVYGLIKRKIKISNTRELTGTPVILLSIFYLIMAAYSVLGPHDIISIPWVIVMIVTLLVILFANKNHPTPSI